MTAMKSRKEIPVSVFTGFLGAGKTTIILGLLKQLPKDYKVVLLKNEFGDIEVDSQLAKESAVEAVSEILNGCMCCVLVGQMRTALLEIQEKYVPDRIIIESSGSAFPATLAWQVRQLDQEGFKLDAVVTVIDCLNFTGYEDTSPTAKMQAKYTDLLLLNKHELATEHQLDKVLDSLYELNTETPKLKISRDTPPKPDLIFGLLAAPGMESKVFAAKGDEAVDRLAIGLAGEQGQHASAESGEVQTCSIWKGGKAPGDHHGHAHAADDHARAHSPSGSPRVTTETLEAALKQLPSEEIWRVKGFLRLHGTIDSSSSGEYFILNWAFGRHELLTASAEMSERLSGEEVEVRLTVMGARGEVKPRARKLAAALGAEMT